MALTLTDTAVSALKNVAKEPNIVVKIEGVDTIFGASIVYKSVLIGDEGLEIGDPDTDEHAFFIGDTNQFADQENIITPDGTSTKISQSLDIDKGQSTSIQNISIALMDDGFATRLISPGVIIDDILERRCLIYYGFNGTNYPDDYIVIFRGRVSDVTTDAGKVVLQISGPDDQKRNNIFKKIETKTIGALTDSTVAVPLVSVDNFLKKVLGPDGTYDPMFKSYLKVDDEIIKYEGFILAQTRTATVTIASPSVWTLNNHGFPLGAPVVPSTTGTLPTGFVAGTTYYVVAPTTNTFELSLTQGGAAINGSVSQTGVHSITNLNMLTGVTRGALTSVAAAHDDEADAATYYELTGNAVYMALKMMASGNFDDDGLVAPYLESQPVSSINVGGADTESNALFFSQTDVDTLFGVTVGDYVTVAGSDHAANNVTGKRVIDIIRGESGDFVVLDDVTFVDDVTSAVIVATFTSQYSTLPDGCQLYPDEIDIAEHLLLYNRFLSSINYDFYIKEGIENAKEFIEMEIYLPMSAYSLPRKARASIGYHIGPIPGQNIVTFNISNIKNPKNLKIKRGMNKNFFNEIVYKFDEDAVEDVFKSGLITISETSKTRIRNSPNKTLTIVSKGLRTIDSAASIAQSASARRLSRYQFGAETFIFSTLLEHGFKVEIGDIIIFDGTDLFLSDIKTGEKGVTPRLLEIQDKQFQLRTGDISFEAVDTNFDGAARYGLISPSSMIQSGISTTQFVIKPSYSEQDVTFEYRKWSDKPLVKVKIRNDDFSVVGETFITSASSNQITVSPALGFVPSADMVMELANYDSTGQTDQIKLVYAFMKDTDFADGSSQFQLL